MLPLWCICIHMYHITSWYLCDCSCAHRYFLFDQVDVERNIKISLIEDPTADAPGHSTLDVENESGWWISRAQLDTEKENWASNIHHLQLFFIYEMLVEVKYTVLRAIEIKTVSHEFRYFFELLFHGADWIWMSASWDWSSSGDAWCAWCLWPAAKARVEDQIVREVGKVSMS